MSVCLCRHVCLYLFFYISTFPLDLCICRSISICLSVCPCVCVQPRASTWDLRMSPIKTWGIVSIFKTRFWALVTASLFLRPALTCCRTAHLLLRFLLASHLSWHLWGFVVSPFCVQASTISLLEAIEGVNISNTATLLINSSNTLTGGRVGSWRRVERRGEVEECLIGSRVWDGSSAANYRCGRKGTSSKETVKGRGECGWLGW